MSIELSKYQKEKLFANHAEFAARGPEALSTLKPVFAVFTPLSVSHLLSTLKTDQHLQPDDMLVAYLASRNRSSEVMGVLQESDRFCVFGFWNLDMYGARARELGKSIEVIDLAEDSIDLDTTCRVLNPFTADGSLLGGKPNEDPRKFELALMPSSSATDRTALLPSLQLYEMDEPRLMELRSMAAQPYKPACRRRYRRR